MGLLLTSTRQGPWAGSSGRLRAKRELQPPWPPLEPRRAFSSGCLQVLDSRENRQVQASGVKPDVALKMKFPSVVQA